MRIQKLRGSCLHPIRGTLKDDPKNIEYKRDRGQIFVDQKFERNSSRYFVYRLNEIVTVSTATWKMLSRIR